MGFPIHELTTIDNRLCPVRQKIAGAVPEQKRYHFPCAAATNRLSGSLI